MPKLTVVPALADARRKTFPVKLTVCEESALVPRPLVPTPSEVRRIAALPALAPAVVVSRPTDRLELFVAPAASRLNEPDAVAAPASAPKPALRDSENPSLAARLLTVRSCDGASPMWTLPKLIESGKWALADARRK